MIRDFRVTNNGNSIASGHTSVHESSSCVLPEQKHPRALASAEQETLLEKVHAFRALQANYDMITSHNNINSLALDNSMVKISSNAATPVAEDLLYILKKNCSSPPPQQQDRMILSALKWSCAGQPQHDAASREKLLQAALSSGINIDKNTSTGLDALRCPSQLSTTLLQDQEESKEHGNLSSSQRMGTNGVSSCPPARLVEEEHDDDDNEDCGSNSCRKQQEEALVQRSQLLYALYRPGRERHYIRNYLSEDAEQEEMMLKRANPTTNASSEAKKMKRRRRS